MRFKRSQALVFTQSESDLVAYNFLTKSVFQCSPDLLWILGRMDDWADEDMILSWVPEFDSTELRQIIQDLVTAGALVEEGSPGADLEQAYASDWQWGLPTALMHFSVQDNAFISLGEAETMQRAKSEAVGLIDLYRPNGPEAIHLPDPLNGKPLIDLMARRRTIRQARPEPVTVEQLADCLFSGMGITGSRTNCVGELPLSMTPSGGARNPYEAYVFAKTVEGVPPGVYHYSALQHTLERIADIGPHDITTIIGGQEWGEGQPCLILLCAHMERTMWKYEDPNAYRVVLIEAGHIGQNIMLTATNYGLSACPTAAIDHMRARSIVGLTEITQAPIYALTLGVPDLGATAGATGAPPHIYDGARHPS